MELMQGTQSAAQRYVFFAERQVWKIPGIADDMPLIPVKKVGMIGAGTMGGGIAMNFANVGIPVVLVETKQDALDRGLGVVRRNYENTAKRGRLKMEDVEKRMALLTGSLDMNVLADCDLVIEAVFENMEIKKQVFAKLDAICKPGAILATNTSALNVNEIATDCYGEIASDSQTSGFSPWQRFASELNYAGRFFFVDIEFERAFEAVLQFQLAAIVA